MQPFFLIGENSDSNIGTDTSLVCGWIAYWTVCREITGFFRCALKLPAGKDTIMAKRTDFTFLSSNGHSNVHAVKWLPEDGQYCAIVQISHGMVECIDRYEEFAKYLTSQGFMVVGQDFVGHGRSVKSPEEFGYFGTKHPSDVLVKDIHKLRKMIQKENPQTPYFMLAHSMGSYMLRKYLGRYSKNLSGAVIVGTGGVYSWQAMICLAVTKLLICFKGDRYRSRLVEQLTYTAPYRKYDLAGKNAENSWLSKDVENVREYYSKEECTFLFTLNAYQGLFEAVYYDGIFRNVQKISKDLPVLFLSGKDDPVGDFGKGVIRVYRMYQRAGIRNVKCVLYPNDRHEVLNETDKHKVYKRISAWLKECVKA